MRRSPTLFFAAAAALLACSISSTLAARTAVLQVRKPLFLSTKCAEKPWHTPIWREMGGLSSEGAVTRCLLFD
jgi:hypothetical protein